MFFSLLPLDIRRKVEGNLKVGDQQHHSCERARSHDSEFEFWVWHLHNMYDSNDVSRMELVTCILARIVSSCHKYSSVHLNDCARICILAPLHAELIVNLLAESVQKFAPFGTYVTDTNYSPHKCRVCNKVYIVRTRAVIYKLRAPRCQCGAPLFDFTPKEAAEWNAKMDAFHARVRSALWGLESRSGKDYLEDCQRVAQEILEKEYPELNSQKID